MSLVYLLFPLLYFNCSFYLFIYFLHIILNIVLKNSLSSLCLSHMHRVMFLKKKREMPVLFQSLVPVFLMITTTVQ